MNINERLVEQSHRAHDEDGEHTVWPISHSKWKLILHLDYHDNGACVSIYATDFQCSTTNKKTWCLSPLSIKTGNFCL